MSITIDRVPKEDKAISRNLMELYQHDHAEWDGTELDEHGLYGYTYLDHYWTEEGRHPFIVRKYRRRGIGRNVAHRIFDMYPGTWGVTQAPGNLTSRAFWERIVSEYTNAVYEQTEEIYQGETRPKQVFQSPRLLKSDK